MTVDKAKILAALKSDMAAADELKKVIDDKIFERRRVYNGELYGNEEDGKSKIVPKVAKRQSEWAHASIKDPFVSTPDIIKCTPITAEDVKAAEQNELLLNYQFCRQFDRYKFMTKAIKVLDIDATLIVQTGWEYEAEEIDIEADVVGIDEMGAEFVSVQTVKDLKVIKNRPTAKVCRSEDVFIDPTCQDNIDNAQFIIHRYETDLSTLKKDGRYKNLDKIDFEGSAANADPDYDAEDKTEFRFKDKPRQKLLVHEYWGNYDIDDDGKVEPIVCAWIGNTIIRLQINPYPDKKLPFIIVPFSSIPFQVHGENNIDLISDQQKVITATIRGIINNMAQSTNGQVGIRKGALDAIQRKKFFKGQNFEFNGTPGDFWQGSYNQIPGSAFDMIALMNNEIESLTGTKGFSQGMSGNALGSTATGVRGVLDATSTRRLDTVRNIAENLIKPLMRKWMAYNAEWLSDEEVIRVTNDEFVPIRRDDISGQVDIDITISTAEDNANKASELSFLLQTLGNTIPFDLTKIILAKMVGLARLPDLELQLKQYQPKSDPIADKKAELELAKLQAEINKINAEAHHKHAGAVENEADKAEKLAKAEVLRAQARKLEAEADGLDLAFVKEDGQITHREKLDIEKAKAEQRMLEKEYDRLTKLDELAFQVKYGGKNEQIGVPK